MVEFVSREGGVEFCVCGGGGEVLRIFKGGGGAELFWRV